MYCFCNIYPLSLPQFLLKYIIHSQKNQNMKKITLLLSFIACAVLANAQNLLSNPSFETWTSGVPASWTLTTTVSAITSQSTDTTSTGSGSAIKIAGPTGTYSLTQIVPAPLGTFNTDSTYTISFKYNVTSGDNTDARIWMGFITSTVGATTT
jgi:hypothetical protein